MRKQCKTIGELKTAIKNIPDEVKLCDLEEGIYYVEKWKLSKSDGLLYEKEKMGVAPDYQRVSILSVRK